MEQVNVVSPDGKVKLTILPNAERLTFTVVLPETTVLDPSTIVMKVDGYDLSAGVVFDKIERYRINKTYPWHGVHSTATNNCNGSKGENLSGSVLKFPTGPLFGAFHHPRKKPNSSRLTD